MATTTTQSGAALEDDGYADVFLDALEAAGVEIVAALPESLLKHVYARLVDDERFRYVRVTNEAELPGILAGAYVGGKKAVMIMENSGIRQSCEAVARFAYSHHMPLVMIMAHRGDLGEKNWWGHAHSQNMKPILDALRIPVWFLRRQEQVAPHIAGALAHAESSQWPVALVLSGDCVNRGQNAAD
jgi:sulfopyruvate decarboxylase subunit alpha